MDLSQLSDSDLKALHGGNLSGMSDAGLKMLSATTGSTQPKRGMFDLLSTPFEMGMTLSQKPRAEQAAFIAPAVEAIGMAGGGALGSGVGPLGTVAGSAAGYAGAKGLMRLVGGTNKPESLSQTARRVGGDVAEGATMEMGGQVIGKGIGLAAPYVSKVVKGMGSGVADVLTPSRLKSSSIAESLNNDPVLMNKIKDLLDQGKTIQEAAALTDAQGLAALVKKASLSSTATQTLYRELDETLKATQANQLAAASQNVNALTQQNLPIATASPTAPRRAVKQALAGEAANLQGQRTALTGQLTAEQQAAEAALAAQRQGVEGGIANVSQLETGQALTAANKAIQEATQKKVVTPAYNAAFKAAPDATINLNGLASTAKGQLAEVLTKIKGTEMAPNASALLERYAPRQVETMVQGVPVKTLQSAKPVTFQEASDISKAISIDINRLKGLNTGEANYARANLQELDLALNDAIKKGVPEEAFKLYGKADDIFKEQILGTHRTGQVANLRRVSTLNEPMLRPTDVVNKVMADEGNTVQFLKVFKQDPAAMQTLKTGVEDLYRQQVLSGAKAATPEAHAKFMSDYARQLGALDDAGMEMSGRLEQIGGQIKGITAAEEALLAQGKAIPGKVAETFKAEEEALNLASTTLGFKQTDKLRSAIVSNPEVAGQALTRMDAPAKSALARGVMQDAGKASEPLKHLVDNEQGILRVLKAHDPKTAQATFDKAKELAELTKLVEQTGNKLGVTAPKNALASQQNLDKLTQGLPEVKAAVKDIQTRIAQGEKFEELAVEGAKALDSPLRLFSDETKPHIFPLNKVMSIVNMIMGRLEGRIDKKLAVEIATELSNSTSAAKLVGGAQVKQLAKTRAANALATTSNVSRILAPASVNALAQ
jgi:hypothetical protein